MKVQFNVEPSDDTDDYLEIYTATLTMPDGVIVVVSATEEDVSYDGFRAEVLEDMLGSLCETVGLPFDIETEDYAAVETEDEAIPTLRLLTFRKDQGDQEDYGDCDNGC